VVYERVKPTYFLINISYVLLNIRPYKGADMGEGAGGTHSKNLVIWNFRYGFNILRDFFLRMIKLLKSFRELEL
jgi:hypothetical protein